MLLLIMMPISQSKDARWVAGRHFGVGKYVVNAVRIQKLCYYRGLKGCFIR